MAKALPGQLPLAPAPFDINSKTICVSESCNFYLADFRPLAEIQMGGWTVIRVLTPTCFCCLLGLYSIHTCSSNMEAFVCLLVCLGRWKRFWLKSPMYSQWTALLLYVVIFMASFMTWWSFFRLEVMFPVQTTFLWLANTSIIPAMVFMGLLYMAEKARKSAQLLTCTCLRSMRNLDWVW